MTRHTDADAGALEAADVARRAIEYCYEHDFTDGLPVVPVTTAYLDEFLARTPLGPDEVIGAMAHLNRECTVRLAAINAAMAGCRPEHFPVVLAAWESLRVDGYAFRGLWQSTTGAAPMFVINGPDRETLGFNSQGNIFGPGARANATVARAIRLVILNVFGVRPHALDQSTQGTPAKYTCCIAENEEASPWDPLHVEHGHDPNTSTATATMTRSCMHLENRHASTPGQLLTDIAGTMARTGGQLLARQTCWLILGPEHAQFLASHGYSKADVRSELAERVVRTQEELDAVGKGALSRYSRWRVPRDHPDADPATVAADGATVPLLAAPESIVVVVAGAANAGVSSVVETMSYWSREDTPDAAPAVVGIAPFTG